MPGNYKQKMRQKSIFWRHLTICYYRFSSDYIEKGTALFKSGFQIDCKEKKMKNKQKHFGIFALVAIIGLLLAGCGEADSGATFTVTYSGNGSTGGTAPVDSNSPYAKNATVTVLGNTGNLVKDGHTFNGWNTIANGSGINYAASETFSITANTTLHAQWTSPYVPGADLAAKLLWIKNNAQDEGEYIIQINANESLAPYTLGEANVNNKTNIKITLVGIGEMREVTRTDTAVSTPFFIVKSGVTLVLDNNITLKGGISSQTGPIVRVEGGTLIMNAGSILKENTSVHGGGVRIVNNGIFNMEGGTITGCTAYDFGGGVHMDSGTFTMNGGTITDCTSVAGGGVYLEGSGTFNLNDGQIIANRMIAGLGTQREGGGGVCVYGDSSFNMTGGTIANNTAMAGGGVFTFSTGSKFTMTGGDIKGNTVVGRGGGLYIYNGIFEKTGGTIYGSDGEENSNSTTGGADDGHAVRKSAFSVGGNAYIDNTHGPDAGRLFVGGTVPEGPWITIP